MTGTFNSVTGNVFEIERWVADGKLHQTLTCKGMTVTRVFKRSQDFNILFDQFFTYSEPGKVSIPNQFFAKASSKLNHIQYS